MCIPTTLIEELKSKETSLSKINRVVLVDYDEAQGNCRLVDRFVKNVYIQEQDNGQTLKIFCGQDNVKND